MHIPARTLGRGAGTYQECGHVHVPIASVARGSTPFAARRVHPIGSHHAACIILIIFTMSTSTGTEPQQQQRIFKRTLTENPYASSQSSANAAGAISPELRERLRGVGSRVRKSVTEGYATRIVSSSSLSLAPPSGTSTPGANGDIIFRSAIDAMNEAYSTPRVTFQSYSAAAAVKRNHATEDDDGDDDEEKDEDDSQQQSLANDIKTQQTPPVQAAQPTPKLFNDRVIRPLPSVNSSRRLFAQTRSLPVGLMRFGEHSNTAFGAGNRGGEGVLKGVTEQEEEEDWSMPSNGGVAVATLKLQTLETDANF